eukprot:sb/3467902/
MVPIFVLCTTGVLAISAWSTFENIKRRTLSGKLYIIIHVLDVLVLILVTIGYGLQNPTDEIILSVARLIIFCAGIWTVALCTVRLIVIASPFYQIKKKLFWLGSIVTMLIYVSATCAAIQLTTIPDDPETMYKNYLIITVVMPFPIMATLFGTALAIFILLRKPNPEVPISPEKRRASWNIILVTMVYFFYYLSHLSVYIALFITSSETHPTVKGLSIFAWSSYIFHSFITPCLVIRNEIREAVVRLINRCYKPRNTVVPDGDRSSRDTGLPKTGSTDA